MTLKTAMRVFADRMDGLAGQDDFVVIKLPAATTGATQPCDVSPIFRSIKSTWRAINAGDFEGVVPSYQGHVEEKLERGGMAKKSLVMYLKFFTCLPSLIGRAFDVMNIQKGWRTTGVWPFDVRVMLGQCRVFDRFRRASSRPRSRSPCL